MPGAQTQMIDVNATNFQHVQRGAQFSPRGPEIATTLFAGLFSAKPGGYLLWNVPDWTAFTTKWSEAAALNLRLVSIDTGQEDPSATWYFGAWNEMTGGYDLIRTTDWTSFMTAFQNNAATMRLLDFDIHSSGGSTAFTGTWGGTPIQQTIISDLSWADFSSQWKTLSNQGKRLTRIQVFPTADSWLVTGLFEEGANDGYALVGVSDWDAFYKYYEDNQKTMQLVDFQVFDDNNSTRWYFGVWRETSSAHQFIFGQDWGSFVNQMNQFAGQGLLLQKAILYPNQVEVPEPQWTQVFENALGQSATGYAYHVLHNGQTVAQGVNHARASQDPPETTWTLDTRMNLASVSKAITAVAVMKLLSDNNISLDAPFYPLVKSQFPTAGPGVDTVTIRNLLQMKSGMVPNVTLFTPSIWTFLAGYLAEQNVPAGAPGNVEEYSNTNFTILQALIDTVTGHGGETPEYYATYVSEKVLTPMGINLAVFNPNPDPQNSATLYYVNGADTNHGAYWGPAQCVAAGGWVSSANELAKFLTGVRNNVVLSADTTLSMLNNNLGWYTYDGIYGQYFHHNGGFNSASTPPQGLATGIIHLSDGYDALLLVNSLGADTIGLMVQAFETRAAAAIASTA